MATDKLAELVVEITTDAKALSKGLKDVRSQLEKEQSWLQKNSKAIATGITASIGAAGALAAASIKLYADLGSEIHDMAIRTGLGADAISELRYAAEQSGSSLSGLEISVRRMAGTITDANDGMETAQRAFERIGVKVEDLKGLQPEEQFMKIASGVASLSDSTLRAATAQDIFGRSGTSLLPLFAEGSAGIAKLRDEAHKLGVTFTDVTAKNAEQLGDTLNKVNNQIKGIQFTIAEALLPNINWWTDAITKNDSELKKWITTTLNWNAEHDKTIAQQSAWRSVLLERQKFLGGLNNEYLKSINSLQALLAQEGNLSSQMQNTILSLKDEVEAHQKVTEIVEVKNELLAISKQVIDGAIVVTNLYTEAEIEAANAAGLLVENVPTAADAVRDFEKAMLDAKEATKKAQREIDDTNRSFENMMSQIRYTGTEAEKFNITMFDVYDAMEKLGYSTDEIRAKWNEWGTDIKFIEDALKLLGLTAEQVNKLLENTGKITTKAVIDIAALQAEIARLYAGGASPAEKEQAILQYQQGRMGYKTEADYLAGTKSGSFIGMQHGGIVTRPTLGLVGEAGPEAVIPLDNMGREVNIFVELDSKIIARAIGLPLVEEIRARTGLK